MIIPDENKKLLPKAAPSITNGEGSSIPPPSYQAAQRPAHITQTSVVHHGVGYPQSPVARFWRAFAVAILIWFLITLLAQSTYSVVRWGNGVWKGDFSIPAAVSLSRCTYGAEWMDKSLQSLQGYIAPLESGHTRFFYSSSTSFELPLSSKTLFFLSRGSQTSGAIKLISSKEKSDVVKVHVTLHYNNKSARDAGIKVCLIKRARSETGVGLFTRQWFSSTYGLHYEATVVLPSNGSDGAPLRIERFETDAPNTSHNIEDLPGLHFSSIDLKGSNSLITATSLSADTAVMQTANSPIRGVFNVSRSLTLRTSNSPIEVDVSVGNEKKFVSDLSMRTRNGRINAHVSLTSEFEGGRYLVSAISSNSPVNVEFPTSPIDSTLRLQATSSNSPVRVVLNAAYEGTFALSTTNFSPRLQRLEVEDPSGRRRKRTVDTSIAQGKILKGSVTWSGHQGPGVVDVTSSNSLVTIEL